MNAAPVPGAGDAGVRASDTIGAAVSAAQELPEAVAQQLLRQAFDAYTDGFALAAILGATVLVLAAIGAGITLRGVATEQVPETSE
jgi:DHA2 family multidrug resistance protein-like MFS transporter